MKAASSAEGFLSMEFAGNLAVIRTVPAFAQPISQAIDDMNMPSVISTIAGNDTIDFDVSDGTGFNVAAVLQDLTNDAYTCLTLVVASQNDSANFHTIIIITMLNIKLAISIQGFFFIILLLICLVAFVPLAKWLGLWGLAVWLPLFGAAIYFCLKMEKIKKDQDIHTYKEIVDFTNGEKLDSIDKAREEGKRNYQKVIAVLAAAAVTVIVLWLISLIIR